jgi:hypothetical protein
MEKEVAGLEVAGLEPNKSLEVACLEPCKGLEKKIVIQGHSNRYQMKKLITPRSDQKKPKKSVLSLSDEVKTYYLLENQPICLSFLLNKETKEEDREKEKEKEEQEHIYLIQPLLLQSIQKKISAYKQQDKKSGKDGEPLITMDELIQKIILSNLLCYYCHEAMYLLYSVEREPKQWSLDRIDNSLGHTNQNVVLCCLQCNLKRRTQNHSAFLFTKQTKIIKTEF